MNCTEGKGEGLPLPENLGAKFERLAGIMARLRSGDGCPWDLEQSQESLARHILEEAYESVEAIESADWGHLSEELGDLLLQIVFQSRIAQEGGRFDLAEVVDGITEKLERRHPHIFGEATADTADQVAVNWDRIKREEEGEEESSSMRMPPGVPAMLAAMKIQGQAARAGFDWREGEEVLPKLTEELEEIREAMGGPVDALQKEVGDLLFTVINLARHVGVDPERALRHSCAEFVGRYKSMESEAARKGRKFDSLSIEAKEELWQAAKTRFDGEE